MITFELVNLLMWFRWLGSYLVYIYACAISVFVVILVWSKPGSTEVDIDPNHIEPVFYVKTNKLLYGVYNGDNLVGPYHITPHHAERWMSYLINYYELDNVHLVDQYKNSFTAFHGDLFLEIPIKNLYLDFIGK